MEGRMYRLKSLWGAKSRLVARLAVALALALILISLPTDRVVAKPGENAEVRERVRELERSLARGWNTWNTYSVMSYVLLPEGVAINLHLVDLANGAVLMDPAMGRKGSVATIRPGLHPYDGSYTDLTISWHGIKSRIQTAHEGADEVILVTPENSPNPKGGIEITLGMLWGRQGKVTMINDSFSVSMPRSKVNVYPVADRHIFLKSEPDSNSLFYTLSDTLAISTGIPRTISKISSIIDFARNKVESSYKKYGKLERTFAPMQSVLGWNVIFSPQLNKVIVPVTRSWNISWNGWVLFDWDTYFASYMISMTDKDLAFANAIAITDQITREGFIPNFGSARGKSDDRSEPPVGSFIVKQIYEKYHDKWFLRAVYDKLLSWNRWWNKNRNFEGYLCWGSTPYKFPPDFPAWLKNGVNALQGAKWESGLDNSPMYDNAVFDTTRHLMLMADVGLMSLYITDCNSLAQIARLLNKPADERELLSRAARYAESLRKLWNEKAGIFLNKNLATGKFSHRLSPTLFYPMLAGVATPSQARKMVRAHFFNKKEFWGKWILPSIARDDSAYKDNSYWRGRIWAPMNFLVYLGLRRYDVPQARDALVSRSRALLLKSWNEYHWVFENYNSQTGAGGDVENSSRFYTWGALLGFMSFIQQGYVPLRETRLR